jgi:hypothetical protein
MSITANLTRYPPQAIAQARSENSLYPPDGAAKANCYLDRSWDELHPALRTFGHPLNLTLSGDYGCAGGLDAFGWDEANTNDHYLAFVSPGLVREISAALANTGFAHVVSAVTGPSRGTEYLAARYRELVEFYSAAAEAGDCVFICIA